MHGQILLLTGPTASGKSAAALEAATRLHAEIISADSMQVYRGMDIGTAKPSLEERRRVPHHLIDIRDPRESFSVADFIREAERATEDICARGKTAFIVGGTPMYIKGFVKGLFAGPSADWAFRRELMARAERDGVPALHAELARVDPGAARRIHANDLRRIVRALEVRHKTGRPISEQQREWSSGSLRHNVVGLILARSREDVCARIDERVTRMFREGLVDEVSSLLDRGEGLGREARQALGYKEVIEYFDGKRSLEETIELVKLKTRQFAKRQMTWFRSFKEFTWVEAGPEESLAETVRKVVAVFGSRA